MCSSTLCHSVCRVGGCVAIEWGGGGLCEQCSRGGCRRILGLWETIRTFSKICPDDSRGVKLPLKGSMMLVQHNNGGQPRWFDNKGALISPFLKISLKVSKLRHPRRCDVVVTSHWNHSVYEGDLSCFWSPVGGECEPSFCPTRGCSSDVSRRPTYYIELVWAGDSMLAGLLAAIFSINKLGTVITTTVGGQRVASAGLYRSCTKVMKLNIIAALFKRAHCVARGLP